MIIIVQQKQPYANNISAMETESIQKNETSLKSLTSERNFMTFAVFAVMLELYMISSFRDEEEEGCGDEDEEDDYGNVTETGIPGKATRQPIRLC
ncbi:MAG: hypothetical protein LBK97_03795 [Prevotellaceae bacterium]|nr:hypothetical protein [Prevotellaceae bacterium]